jgi:hypothetical protein
MKTKSKLILGSLAMVTLFTVSSCNSASENVTEAQQNVNEANDALDEANQAYLEDIAEYRIATARDIAYNDSLIVDLKARSKVSGKKSNPDYDNQIAELETKNADMKKKIDEYEGDGPDHWTSFKEEFAHDMQELGTALRDLGKNNKE